MRPLSAATLLDVWERGYALPPARQALLLMAAARPEEDPGEHARRPVGRRDADLMTLRALTFGERLEGVVSCPSCEELLELDARLEDLRVEAAGEAPARMDVERGGCTVRFRLPTAGDLAAAVEEDDIGPRDLLIRCVLEVVRDGEALPPEALPDDLVAAVAERMKAADPQADVRLDLTCPSCDHRWESPFDIVSYVWAEIDRWARRTLRDVHELSAAHGWSEADVLAMSAWRRRAYLNLVRR